MRGPQIGLMVQLEILAPGDARKPEYIHLWKGCHIERAEEGSKHSTRHLDERADVNFEELRFPWLD